MTPAMLTPLSPEDARRLRDFLAETGYTDQEFRRRPMLRELPSPQAGNLPYLLECTREPVILNLLLRWFVLGVSVESGTAASVVPPPILALLLDSGMVVHNGDWLVPSAMLTPCDEYVFAADPAPYLQSPRCADVVLWPNATSRLLHWFSIRRPWRTTLDLGAGCGIQAILAAHHSLRVTATDLNPRAAEFTLFNTRLNGVENLESFTGDTFEPVQDRSFDLIVANPPFFVTPSSELLYCENSMDLDGYCRRVVREAAGHLNEGGYLQMVFEWVQVRGQSWQDRLAGWFEGIGCDAWVLRGYVRDPAAYTQERTKNMWLAPGDTATARFERYMDYYRARGVEEIQGGLLALRRRTGQNWTRMEEMPLEAPGPFGDSVLATFASQDALAAHGSDQEMLGLKPRLAPGVEMEQRWNAIEGEWKPLSAKLLLATLPASLAVEAQVAGFVARLDGSRTLGELAGELAARVNAAPGQVRQQCCAVVRKLIERRFVLV